MRKTKRARPSLEKFSTTILFDLLDWLRRYPSGPERLKLPCKLTLNPISPVANPCCNPPLKIGAVLSLGMDDATALQSRQSG
jgi:hypothetical protein